jgi:hypothetical protein
MSNIKLFGNTKIQGKSFFQLSGSAPTPTYAIRRSIYDVNEGSSVVFTLSTTNVANGTTIPYTLSGISLSDLSSGSLSGNFIVSNNLATATVSLTADNLTEGTEQIIIALNNGQASSFALAIDTSLSLPMTLSGTNLVGWYDYTYGAFNNSNNANGFGTIDDNRSVAPSWLNIPYNASYPNRVLSWSSLSRSQTKVNGRASYSGLANFSPVAGTDYSQIPFDPILIKGSPLAYYVNWDHAEISLYWTGLNWRLSINSFYYTYDENTSYNTSYTPNSIYWDATGDTAYPWQANWGSGKTLNIPIDNSTKATQGQTISIWNGRVGPTLYQDTLALQPVLSADSIQFNTKWLVSTFSSQFATRTYYFVGNSRNTQNNTSRSILNYAGTTSTASTMRHALISRNSSNAQRYGLSQGTTTAASIQSTYAPLSSWTGKPQIVCASFSSANNGKISLNNSSESSLTAIGNNFPSTDVNGHNLLFIGSSEANSFTNIKEILIYSTVHTTAQKTQVINYLNAKYNAF